MRSSTPSPPNRPLARRRLLSPSPVRSARRQSTPSPPRRPPSVSPRRPAVPPSSVGPPPPKKRFSSGQLRTLLCQKIGQYAIEQKALVGWTEQRKREIGEALDQALLALREAVLDGIDVSVHLTNRQAVQLRSLRRALLSTDADEDDDAVSIVSASPPGTQLTPGMSTQRSTEKTELANWPLIDFERLLNLLILWIFWFF
ncbi:hypothetical protein niasHS_015760 [Heterodera schachtii]|uniref:Uncharacterized protein n=1 Tax=Heterodera schachtii TaxID=97005 RepID=A0ABD2HQ17_HETSC